MSLDIESHLLPRRSSFRSRTFWFIAIFISIIFILVITPLPDQYDKNRDALVEHISEHISETAKDNILDHLPGMGHHDNKAEAIQQEGMHSKYAFATYLAGSDKEVPYEQDYYFIATRILAYQLLHAQETKSRDREIPFIVMVTDKVPERQQTRLRKDGAVVIQVPHITSSWAHPGWEGWSDIYTKLRLWELVQFDRVCFLDVDHELTGPLDGIFNDPAVQVQQTRNNQSNLRDDEAPLPSEFVMASVPETNHEHGYPPKDEANDFPNINYMNAGFFVLKPDVKMLEYYLSVLNIEDRFDSSLMEQNLLNYAHRRESEGGNIPWMQLGTQWNIHYPSIKDVEGGVKSVHEKWWGPEKEDMSQWMAAWRWRMEGYYEAKDQMFSG